MAQITYHDVVLTSPEVGALLSHLGPLDELEADQMPTLADAEHVAQLKAAKAVLADALFGGAAPTFEAPADLTDTERSLARAALGALARSRRREGA